MARCRKCDRCGKYYEPKGDITNNVGTTTFNNDNEETTSVIWYDLCPECAADFDKWFGFPKLVNRTLSVEQWEEDFDETN